ncbi:MAG: L,D-transpeptidase family protein [Proteobacteria bacterium]|nr:L,D-transpeptidase family protein [Pseudomonadota bacterium]
MTRINCLISALCLIFCCACQSGQCPSGAGGASGHHAPSRLAEKIAKAFPGVIADQASERLNVEKRQALQKAVEDREAAEKAYQAAKARKERPKPLPRVRILLDADIEKSLPDIVHNSLIAELYGVEAAEHQFFFIREGVLTPAGRILLERLDAADLHVLDFEPSVSAQIKAGIARLGHMRAHIAQNREGLNAFEIDALSDALGKELAGSETPIAPDAFRQLPEDEQIKLGVRALCDFDGPVPRAAAMCVREYEYRRDIDALDEALEFVLADIWLRYAEQLKYGNLLKYSKEELEKYASEENPNEIHPKYHERVIETRLAKAFEEFVSLGDSASIERYFDALVPQHEQYARLQAVRETYRAIVDNGGWAVVPPDRMFAGGHAPLVKNLKTRLQVEGYYTGAIDDHFDPALTAAIRMYQRHHQLEENGEVGEVFWRSLNVPAEQRLAEIEVNIRRWHKTMFEARETFIYINIPSFAVELWHKGKMVSRRRAVVGSSTKICNTRTREWELMNSTRLMHAQMTYLVFNPYWNVPPRIEVDEFQPKIAADPKWLANSDYEYYTPKGGGRVLRQKPGPENALGKVKLIFPNRYNIYLHDTPKQGMFKYPVRAFSHGCIRVEGAFKFAREVLEIDGQWDDKRISKFFKESGEHPVDLKTPIDVFIDYHTVTVDDEGAYFLADIYKFIKDEISPPTALERRCDPSVARTSLFRSGGGEDSGP